MKKHFAIIALFLLASFFMLGCETVGGSGSASVLDKSFVPDNSKISLLPPRFKFGATGSIEVGSEQSIGRLVFNALVKRTSSNWLSPEESVSLIQDANVLEEYESMLDGYLKTGIPSKAKLMKLSNAVNCPYITLCQIDHAVTEMKDFSNYRKVGITIQVLSAIDGKVVLELFGNSKCGYGAYDIGAVPLLQKAIDEAISYFPGAKKTE